jgi:hypothetical protein
MGITIWTTNIHMKLIKPNIICQTFKFSIKIGMLNALDEYIIQLPILYLLTSLNLKSYSKVHFNFSQLFTMNIAYYYYDTQIIIVTFAT